MFGPGQIPALRTAVAELGWLRARGYAEHASIKLVGDRHELRARQRTAVVRGTCTDGELDTRAARRVGLDALAGRSVALDGFNVLIAVEVAFAGGVLLRGRDGVLRDLASVHGSYRRTAHTLAACEAVGELLVGAGAGAVLWLFDRPVSNSGRLKLALAELARARAWSWEIELDYDPDRRLAELSCADGPEPAQAARVVVASADAWILDHSHAHIDLAAQVIAQRCPGAWIVDLAEPGTPG